MRIPLSLETIVIARVALQRSIKGGLKVRHSLPATWRANIRADIAALRELDGVQADFTVRSKKK